MTTVPKSMLRTAAFLSLLVSFHAGWAYGVDIVVKIDKYAPVTEDCDTAINNVEVIMFECRRARLLYKLFQTSTSGHFSEK